MVIIITMIIMNTYYLNADQTKCTISSCSMNVIRPRKEKETYIIEFDLRIRVLYSAISFGQLEWVTTP